MDGKNWPMNEGDMNKNNDCCGLLKCYVQEAHFSVASNDYVGEEVSVFLSMSY